MSDKLAQGDFRRFVKAKAINTKRETCGEDRWYLGGSERIRS